jgi:hypothetical protein
VTLVAKRQGGVAPAVAYAAELYAAVLSSEPVNAKAVAGGTS